MAAQRANARSNFTIGVVTLLIIAGVSAAGMLLPGLLREPLLRYQLRVAAGEDLSGVEEGTLVSVAGLVRGQVLSVKDQTDPDGSISFVVSFEINPDPPIYPGATARFVRDLVSNKSRIDFVDAGDPGTSSLPLAPDGAVDVNNEPNDAALLLTPAARRAFDTTWQRLSAAPERWKPVLENFAFQREQLQRDIATLRQEFDETFPGYYDRASALRDRYLALAEEWDELAATWEKLRTEFNVTRSVFSSEGDMGRLGRAFELLAERWGLLDGEGQSLASIVQGIGRRWTDLTESGVRFRDGLRLMAEEAAFGEILADLSIAAEEFARLTGGGLGTVVRAVIPNTSADEARADAFDDLSRVLLLGVEEARGAAQALDELLRLGEPLPATAAELDRLLQSIERLGDLERSLWRLRIDRAPRK